MQPLPLSAGLFFPRSGVSVGKTVEAWAEDRSNDWEGPWLLEDMAAEDRAPVGPTEQTWASVQVGALASCSSHLDHLDRASSLRPCQAA